MQAPTFWKIVTKDHANFLEQLIETLRTNETKFCIIGDQGVNAYVDPVVSLDLDLVVAVEQIEEIEEVLSQSFSVKRFPHSINISLPESDLRVQIQTDPRYFDFVERVSEQEVLGLVLPVASLEDLIQGKIWAALAIMSRSTMESCGYFPNAHRMRLVFTMPPKVARGHRHIE